MKNYALMALLFAYSAGAMAAEPSAQLDPKTVCKLEYPRAALLNEEKGTVVLSLLVLADGTVSDAKIEKTSGSSSLDRTSVASIKKCKMLPPAGGKQWQILSYVWSLE